jgi:hypothetical protein
MKFFALAAALLPAVIAVDNRRHFYTTDPNGENAGSAGYTRQQGVVAWVL